MALDALVDSTHLDSDLKDVADAIREKTGKLSTINFPQGFIDEIEDIESNPMTSGTYTPASNSKNASFTVLAGTTNFVFYATDFNTGTADAGWHTVGGVWLNSVGQAFLRYNEANTSVGNMTATLNGTTLSITAPYKLRTEKTYKWYAW